MTETNLENPTPATALGIGERLKKEREAKNLSIADVADSLKLRVAQVQSIEQGEFSKLSGDAFARGFIRNYARLLDISDEIMPLLDVALPTANRPATKPQHDFHEEKSSIGFPKWLKWLIILILLAGAVYFWQQQSAKQNQIREDSQSAIADAPDTQLTAENIKVVPMPEEKTVIESVEEPEQNPTESTTKNTKNQLSSKEKTTVQADKTAENPVKKPVPSNRAKDALYINIKYRSYLTVKDENGDILINQLVPGGSEHQFSGKPPYQVRIGYALGSSIELNGENIDLSKYMNGKTATLTVPEQP